MCSYIATVRLIIPLWTDLIVTGSRLTSTVPPSIAAVALTGPSGRASLPVPPRHATPRHAYRRNASRRASTARLRWDNEFFCSLDISAKVSVLPSGTKIES